jgi:H+/Na+-translocating ferredoxin:NAD+ oxidoreductase subunit G
MDARRKTMRIGLLFGILLLAALVGAQEGIFLKEDDAAKAVFPEATAFERKIIRSNAGLREKIRQRLAKTKTSIWEESYVTFIAKKGETLLGYAVIVEEIGKHRPITFIVGIGADRKIKDAALMIYREAYGGEVRDRRFLQQFKGKQLKDPLLPFRDIQNISGATMSVEAIGRGSKKALALVEAVYLDAVDPK